MRQQRTPGKVMFCISTTILTLSITSLAWAGPLSWLKSKLSGGATIVRKEPQTYRLTPSRSGADDDVVKTIYICKAGVYAYLEEGNVRKVEFGLKSKPCTCKNGLDQEFRSCKEE